MILRNWNKWEWKTYKNAKLKKLVIRNNWKRIKNLYLIKEQNWKGYRALWLRMRNK